MQVGPCDDQVFKAIKALSRAGVLACQRQVDGWQMGLTRMRNVLFIYLFIYLFI